MSVITGNLVNITARSIKPVIIEFDSHIRKINFLQNEIDPSLPFILPGFIDAHIHVESSMLIPAEFARLAVTHGTVSTISDPHEIANVCGIDGIQYMIDNGKTVPFKFNFGAPSCVPATSFETAGAILDSNDIHKLLKNPEIRYLSEMMNFPGALNGDQEVMKKIKSAQELGKPVDGHAPGLRGEAAKKYIDLGISTDHECFTIEEAAEKLGYGMKIIIREGSAARNFEALIPLLHDHPHMIMFGSDDKHPDELATSHINTLCARAVEKGIDVFNVLQAACINPVHHYKLDVGLLNENDPADFITIKDLTSFNVLDTYINGQHVARNGKTLIERKSSTQVPNNFTCSPITAEELTVSAINNDYTIPVIEAIDGQLITLKSSEKPLIKNGACHSNINNDVLKIVVVNRYSKAPIAKAFIKNIGLKKGSIASSVAHDSHNIVAVGVDDESLMHAINMVIEVKGGVSIYNDSDRLVLPLPVAGLMSSDDGYKVGELYSKIDAAAKRAGSTLRSPYMTLSFMALLVIPNLKLSDKGLFDGETFTLIDHS